MEVKGKKIKAINEKKDRNKQRRVNGGIMDFIKDVKI